jgi:hypothetical protein
VCILAAGKVGALLWRRCGILLGCEGTWTSLRADPRRCHLPVWTLQTPFVGCLSSRRRSCSVCGFAANYSCNMKALDRTTCGDGGCCGVCRDRASLPLARRQCVCGTLARISSQGFLVSVLVGLSARRASSFPCRRCCPRLCPRLGRPNSFPACPM